MMSKKSEVIVIKGEFTRDEKNDIIVQEYVGEMLFLQKDECGQLLNIQKLNDPFNLTDYIEKYIEESKDTISHLVINRINCNKLSDIVNPFIIATKWKNHQADSSSITQILHVDSSPITQILHPGNNARSSTIINTTKEENRKKINGLNGIDTTKSFIYMEIYVYFN